MGNNIYVLLKNGAILICYSGDKKTLEEFKGTLEYPTDTDVYDVYEVPHLEVETKIKYMIAGKEYNDS